MIDHSSKDITALISELKSIVQSKNIEPLFILNYHNMLKVGMEQEQEIIELNKAYNSLVKQHTVTLNRIESLIAESRKYIGQAVNVNNNGGAGSRKLARNLLKNLEDCLDSITDILEDPEN